MHAKPEQNKQNNESIFNPFSLIASTFWCKQAQVTRQRERAASKMNKEKKKNLGRILVQKSDCCVQNPRITDFLRVQKC